MNRTFRMIQPISAGAVAFAHGSNDAQKTMGIITLALVTSGHLSEHGAHPDWVIVLAATAMALGTYFGGWRIIHTLGTKVIKLDPIHGFAAETSAASVIYGAGHFFGFPISTTQTITASIMGAGATGGLVRREVGSRREHRDGLDPDPPGGRGGRRSRLPAPAPRPLGSAVLPRRGPNSVTGLAAADLTS